MSKSEKIIVSVISAIAVIAIAALSVALGFADKKIGETDKRLDAIYQKSYYDATDSMADIEMKLSKINVLSGRDLKRSLLTDVWRETDVATTNLAFLGVESEDLTKIIKFLNQLGDYSLYLTEKLKSDSLSEKENDNLRDYYGIIKRLNSGLAEAKDKLTDGDKIDGKFLTDNSLFDGILKDHSSIDYPEMIYDGPFSDGLNDRETKFLTGKEEISPQRGLELVLNYFPEAQNIKSIGEGASEIPTYLYEFELGRNVGTVQITKIGGYVAMYNAYCEITDPTLSEEECVQKANGYLQSLGYENMKAVWVCNNNSTVYINYAYVQDGIILYPDLIKVKICSQTGDLIGVEAQNYLYNHTERELVAPENHVETDLHVESRAFCLIPTDQNKEIMAEEVVVTDGDMTFYLYFDRNGEEIRAMAVIDEDGKLLV